MLQTARSYRGMVTAPHHLAAQAGLRVLQDNGNAIEAMIAAAAAITVAYPHMNSLGGDNFWLIHTPGKDVIGIDACGAAAAAADIEFFLDQGLSAIPERGALAAVTVAGAVSGWQAALEFSKTEWGGTLPLERLLEDAIFWASDGISVTKSLAENARLKHDELIDAPGFKEAYFNDGKLPAEGSRHLQPRIAETLAGLAETGLDDFYRGALAHTIAHDLERAGSPLRAEDLASHRAIRVQPLMLEIAGHQVYNMPPPTQGLASLLLLGVYQRLGVSEAETFDFVHAMVESTKRAFAVRDRHVTDPAYVQVNPEDFLNAHVLDDMARDVDMKRALPWPQTSTKGDTVWLGAIDNEGRTVSFIQSIYWEFGSGTVLQNTGITWQNRGTSFSLDPTHLNCLEPRRRPFHTIQPALARLADGRVMAYGTMGGDGQPQTQAMLFARHVLHGQGLQEAISAPRWLLGRTWGAETTNLRLESRFAPELVAALRSAGHDIQEVGPFDEVMGQSGAVVQHPDGLIEGAADPRSDGGAAGC